MEDSPSEIRTLEISPSGCLTFWMLALLDVCPSDVCPSDVRPLDVLPLDVCPSDICPLDVLPSDVCPSDVCPSDVLPSDVLPSDVLPSDGDVIYFSISTENAFSELSDFQFLTAISFASV